MRAKINGKEVEFSPNETILEVAKKYGHFIPTLCEMKDINNTPATCRVCLIEIKRANSNKHLMVTACDSPMEEGCEVFTRTARARESQRMQVEMILADHNQDCATCIRHGNCELQDIAQFVGLTQTRYSNPDFYKARAKDNSSKSIYRDMSKCIRCKRCITVCREVQGTDALLFDDKGLNAQIGIREANSLHNSRCVNCGQCSLVCPVGALAEKDDTEIVIDHLYNPDIFTVFQFAPAVRIALGEEFFMPLGTNVQGKIITALNKLGANVVLDTNFAADLVIMEEGSELISRINNNDVLPMITSCSPGWINYIEKNYPEMLPHLSTVKSPQQCFGSIAKTYLAEKIQIAPEKIRVISIMPCTAKKDEASRAQMNRNGKPDVDVVLTTREFARLLKREGIWLPDLEDSNFDNSWIGEASGAAEVFGTTGGVMEAAIRTVYYVVNGSELPEIEFTPVRGYDNYREASVNVGGNLGTINVAVAHGLKTAAEVMENIKKGEKTYHFVEIMACPGGCMNGGGQPKQKKNYQTFWHERQKAIYNIDSQSTVRQSHNNKDVQRLYEEFLQKPLSHVSHQLLHTNYTNRKVDIKHTIKEIWDELKN